MLLGHSSLIIANKHGLITYMVNYSGSSNKLLPISIGTFTQKAAHDILDDIYWHLLCVLVGSPNLVGRGFSIPGILTTCMDSKVNQYAKEDDKTLSTRLTARRQAGRLTPYSTPSGSECTQEQELYGGASGDHKGSGYGEYHINTPLQSHDTYISYPMFSQSLAAKKSHDNSPGWILI
ncbi:hypothetical protein EI94DRAFT_1708223 [Lactarius quietus]|nr:hypothetical protein EI94DRAFT_1708223 [Lactarius quietus]